MHKQWRKRSDIAHALVVKWNPLPRIPRLRPQWISRRTHPQQVHHHHLVVIVPAIRQEPDLRQPAMRKERSILRKPRPLHTVADRVRQQSYIGVAEMST